MDGVIYSVAEELDVLMTVVSFLSFYDLGHLKTNASFVQALYRGCGHQRLVPQKGQFCCS